MALGTWNNTGDYYVSDKFGDDANDGSQTAPLRTLQKAIHIVKGQGYKKVIIKPGEYTFTEVLDLTNVLAHFISEGEVKLFGSSSSNFMIPNQNWGIGLDYIWLDNFYTVGRTSANHAQFTRIYDYLTITGATHCTFYDINIFYAAPGNSSFPYNDVIYRNCNFIDVNIRRTSAKPIFINCFFNANTTINKEQISQPDTFEFINCRFQDDGSNRPTILDIDWEQFKNENSESKFIKSESLFGSPGFNRFEGYNDFQDWDLTLKYNQNSNLRSKLYLGAGVYIGPHKFAIPIERTNQAFADTETTGPYTNDDIPIWENLSISASTGLLSLINSTKTGRIRSSGTTPLTFKNISLVNRPFRFSGNFVHLNEFIDTDTTDDRPSIKVRFKDLDTGSWTSWYDMVVNGTWQIDGNNRGNGHPQFDVNSARFVKCQQYQIDLIINPINE